MITDDWTRPHLRAISVAPAFWWALAGIAIMIAALRVAGVKSQFYQALAHLLVGGLAWGWLVEGRRLTKWFFLILTFGVEIPMFLLQRLFP